MTAATECGYKIFPHPLYSPDIMAPSDFDLFLKLKSHLRGTQYWSIEGVIETVNEYLSDQEKALYFEEKRKLEQRWAKCIALKCDYIETLLLNFHSLVARSVRGLELSDNPSYILQPNLVLSAARQGIEDAHITDYEYFFHKS